MVLEETVGRDEEPTKGAAYWRETLAPYAKPHLGRSMLDILTSVIPYLGLSALMYFALNISYLLVLLLAVPTAGFLLRTFIVFHDCAHGSFLPWRKANAWLGAFCGLLVFSPFKRWRHHHAVHHATSGDLERRGVGDVHTLTVAEYKELSRKKQLGYRLFQSPFVMFTIGPIYSLVIGPRLVPRDSRRHIRNSIIGTNLALAVMIGLICWFVGWSDYLLVQMPIVFLAGTAGVWLFYLQHQFEDAYWQDSESWDYADAALKGSSYLKLPKILQFFTGSIGVHHVHHLNARIPNYNLQRAHDENPVFHSVPTLSFGDGLRTTRLKLWDEQRGRMVTFAEASEPPQRSRTKVKTHILS